MRCGVIKKKGKMFMLEAGGRFFFGKRSKDRKGTHKG